jgi:hypothetical protein
MTRAEVQAFAKEHSCPITGSAARDTWFLTCSNTDYELVFGLDLKPEQVHRIVFSYCTGETNDAVHANLEKTFAISWAKSKNGQIEVGPGVILEFRGLITSGTLAVRNSKCRPGLAELILMDRKLIDENRRVQEEANRKIGPPRF